MSKRGHFADDLTGQRFGSLSVIGKAPSQVYIDETGKKHTRAMWFCQCDCGSQIKMVRASHLKSGAIVSCGCIGRKHSAEAKVTHGLSSTKLYGIWLNMKNRCYNPKVRSFKTYGNRGITVCEDWKNDFSVFSEWALANGYNEGSKYGECTLERINVDGPYSPENCTFVNLEAQANNRTTNVHVKYGGETYTLAQLSKHLGINYGTLQNRIKRGWPNECLGLPTSAVALKRRKIEMKGWN